LTRALQLSPVFRRHGQALAARALVKAHPAVQSLITGEQTKQDSALTRFVGKPGTPPRRIRELVQKKIPANSKEIAIARSYGDLRENHEYKAAKEMQKILMRRKEELETQLARARGTDFSNANTDAVNIGTIVQATNLETNQSESFTILGAWDSDPDKGIISYLSPVGAALLNHKTGDEVEFELHGTKRRQRIEKMHVEPRRDVRALGRAGLVQAVEIIARIHDCPATRFSCQADHAAISGVLRLFFAFTLIHSRISPSLLPSSFFNASGSMPTNSRSRMSSGQA
jgi:transcription elongation GreA/GreB family factor